MRTTTSLRPSSEALRLAALATWLLPASAWSLPSIENASAETAAAADGKLPLGWQAEAWGGVVASHGWLPSGGQQGLRALRVEVNKAGSEGDARWASDWHSVAADAGSTRAVRHWYRASATSHAWVQVRSADSKQSAWLSIAAAPAAAGWSEHSGNVALPVWAAQARVMHTLAVPGWLETDAWSWDAAIEAPPPDDPPPPQDADPALAPASLAKGNVLPNPSFEQASPVDASRPAWWTFVSWGEAKAAGTWETQTQLDGKRALRLTQTAAPSEGDGKWWSAAIPVTDIAGTLRLSCHYRGTATATLLLRADNGKIDAKGAPAADFAASWAAPAQGPPWAEWRILSGLATLPAWTANVRVGLRIDGVGQIDIDQCSLQAEPAAPAPTLQTLGDSNLLANPSFEQPNPWDPALPAAWQGVVWGAAAGQASWIVGGSAGLRAVRVELAGAGGSDSGDGRWESAPVWLASPGRVRLRDRYRANVATSLLLRVRSADGAEQAWLATPPLLPAPDWTEAELVADLPAFAARVEVMHVVAQPGWLEVDEVDLREGPPGPLPTTDPEVEPPSPVEPVPPLAVLGATNAVPNASMEQVSSVDAALPRWWGGSAAGPLQASWQRGQPGVEGDWLLRMVAKRTGDGDGHAAIASRSFGLQVPTAADETSAWARLEALVESDVAVTVMVRVVTDDGEVLWRDVIAVAAKPGWQTVAGKVALPGKTATLQVVFVARDGGTVAVDGVILVGTEAPPSPQPTDAGNTPVAGFDMGPAGPTSTAKVETEPASACQAGRGGRSVPAAPLVLLLLAMVGIRRRRHSLTDRPGMARRRPAGRLLGVGVLLALLGACADEVVVEPWRSRTTAKGFELSRDGSKWSPFWPLGVNFGLSVPGSVPGEMAADGASIRRWLAVAASAGANSIRVYTVQSPVFYEELRRYNLAHPDTPLLLFQGIWVDEPPVAVPDYFSAASDAWVDDEIDKVVGALHGDVTIQPGSADNPNAYGRAYGTFDADVSPWTIGWLFGREMEPYTIETSVALHPEAPTSYQGSMLSIVGDDPVEAWIVGKMDKVLATERSRYGQQRPIGFSNWPTLDPLVHPSEPKWPNSTEDIYQVDLEPVTTSAAFTAGVYMSYHAYPYYPDFILHQASFQGGTDAQGKFSYVGYLKALRAHHANHALVVAEVGHPSSLGNGHQTPTKQDHGGLNELEQGPAVVRSVAAVAEAGLDGAMVFAIIDEWFKRAWVVERVETPASRRQLWHNVMNPEQNFGLVALRAGRAGKRIVLDGADSEWPKAQATAGAQVAPLGDGHDARRRLRDLTVTADAAFVHVRVRMEPFATGSAVDWSKLDVLVAFDSIDPARGDSRLDPAGKVQVGRRVEHLLRIESDKEVQLYVDKPYDLYGLWHGLREPWQLYRTAANDQGIFHPVRTITNRYSAVGADGEELAVVGGTLVQETGRFRVGPASIDSNALVAWDGQTGVIEVRIPWNLLHVTDPSSRQIVDDDGSLGPRRAATATTTAIAVAAVVLGGSGEQEQDLVDSIPAATAVAGGHALPAQGWAIHTLEPWEEAPAWHEYVKPIVQELRNNLPARLPSTIAWPTRAGAGGAP